MAHRLCSWSLLHLVKTWVVLCDTGVLTPYLQSAVLMLVMRSTHTQHTGLAAL